MSRAIADRAATIRLALEDRLATERSRWVLWLPVGIGAGIGLYFALPAEPPAWPAPIAVAAAIPAAVAAARRGRAGAFAAALVLATVAAGFALADARTALVDAPVLAREIAYAEVAGRVAAITPRNGGARTRLLLDRVILSGRPPAETPRRVRLTLGRGTAPPPLGALVRLGAGLYPPPAPAAPGAYDFRRTAYFARIGAVGYARSRITVLDPAPAGLAGWIGRGLGALRHTIETGIRTAIAPPVAGIAITLMTGERAALDPDLRDAFRASGLAHLLAISGLHITLIAGLAFFVSRWLLASRPRLALTQPIKKWAALIGVVAAAGYMLLVGARVPTLRAVLMATLAMVAILADRNPLSLRLVATAALIILVTTPDTLLTASFQMSFAAVVALIAAYESFERPLRRLSTQAGPLLVAALYLGGLVLTSAVATLATLPFTLIHFQQIALYGIAANMLAVPLTAYWIMPCALAAYAAWPLGLAPPILEAMELGLTLLAKIATTTAALPGAVLRAPAPGDLTLPLCALGGLWLCIWTTGWRLLGLVPLIGGLALGLTARPPDILVSRDAQQIAVRTATGGLSFNTGAAATDFTGEVWLRRAGRAAADPAWPPYGRSPDGRLACDPHGCRYHAHDTTVALVKSVEALAEDCRRHRIVISLVAAGRTCTPPHLIDYWDLRNKGAHAIWLDDTEPRIQVAKSARPWGPP